MRLVVDRGSGGIVTALLNHRLMAVKPPAWAGTVPRPFATPEPSRARAPVQAEALRDRPEPSAFPHQHRHRHGEDGPARRGVLDADPAAVAIDAPFDDGQAQAGSGDLPDI